MTAPKSRPRLSIVSRRRPRVDMLAICRDSFVLSSVRPPFTRTLVQLFTAVSEILSGWGSSCWSCSAAYICQAFRARNPRLFALRSASETAMDDVQPLYVLRISGPIGTTDHMYMINHSLNKDIPGTGIIVSDPLDAKTTNGLAS